MTLPIDRMLAAYDAASDAWGDGPEGVYDQLAEAVVAAVPGGVGARRVLDVGAGTGAGCRAVRAAGGVPVAVDAAPGMAARARVGGFIANCGDAAALPYRAGAFDAAVAAFSLTHLPDPVTGLREMARVVASGGGVAASAFPTNTDEHPAKAAVETAAGRFGWHAPDWYVALKSHLHALGAADRFAATAAAAGLIDVEVAEARIDLGALEPSTLVAYRLGMPNLAHFVSSLDDRTRAALINTALELVSADPRPLRPAVLILRARTPECWVERAR